MFKFLLAAFVMFLGLTSATATLAQVPPHPPGTVCLTPYSWCWLGSVGTVGAACSCAGATGTII